MATFLEWLEQHLGATGRGYESGLTAGRTPVFICPFADQPADGATTYVTVGLNKTWLHAGEDHVRQELLLSRWGGEEEDCARLLMWAAKLALDSTDAIVRGALLGPAGPLLPGATVEAFVGLHPAYHPEPFDAYRDDAGGEEGHPPVRMRWLAPITADEAAFVREHGVERFVELMVERDPDLLDWSRSSSLTEEERRPAAGTA